MPTTATSTASSNFITIKREDRGPRVKQLQELLSARGFTVNPDGRFGLDTYRAVRAFQSQNLDVHGQPLTIDGKVGPLTWWSLNNPKPDVPVLVPYDFSLMPPSSAGGSNAGRGALAVALSEMKAGAREIGGNNSGPFVKKYLAGAGLPEGNSWCASFVSWCLMTSSGGKANMPLAYCPSARGLLQEGKDKGWALSPGPQLTPQPGDLVIWWREKLEGWLGHVGFVHQLKDGMLYTIEGNKSPRVQGFSYVYSRMEKLLGYVHIP